MTTCILQLLISTSLGPLPCCAVFVWPVGYSRTNGMLLQDLVIKDAAAYILSVHALQFSYLTWVNSTAYGKVTQKTYGE